MGVPTFLIFASVLCFFIVFLGFRKSEEGRFFPRIVTSIVLIGVLAFINQYLHLVYLAFALSVAGTIIICTLLISVFLRMSQGHWLFNEDDREKLWRYRLIYHR